MQSSGTFPMGESQPMGKSPWWSGHQGLRSRVYKLVEDTNSKRASVVSEVLGKSARRLVEAWVAGARDAAKLSAMALGSLRLRTAKRWSNCW
jgi:hypothetical protein